MKKLFAIFAFIGILPCNLALAQDAGNFYENILISDDMKLEENSDSAKANARKLLDTKPAPIKIKAPQLRRNIKSSKADTSKQPKINYGSAPFGLTWGLSMADVKNMGVILEKAGEKDYVNNFSATYLPNPVNEFRDIVLTFGEENQLWRIIAYGDFIKDDAKASKVMNIYNRYYKLLSQKYGNSQQSYTPKVTNVDKTVDIGSGRTKTVTEQRNEPIGGANFLQELQSGEANLYSTFENGKVGVALAISVDGQGRSYIIIDYKNLEIMKSRDNSTLKAL